MKNKRRKFTENETLILYAEAEGVCPLCPNTLMYKKNSNQYKEFEIAHIYPLNPKKEELELLKDAEKLSGYPNDLKNLVCLCVSCHTKFDKPRTLDEYVELVTIKKTLLMRDKDKSIWSDTKIEKEIIDIIETLSSQEIDLGSMDILSYDPKEIDRKVNKTITELTKRKIHRNVQDYFPTIKSKFIEIDKLKPTTTEIISTQIRTHYLKLNIEYTELRQQEIFFALVGWLSKTTKQHNDEASEIIISYFIQNCEVF
jgi:HNH endonuclease